MRGTAPSIRNRQLHFLSKIPLGSRLELASHLAGATSGEGGRMQYRNRWALSLSAKTAFLAVVFILVPVFLYLESGGLTRKVRSCC
jgi:hypothetical protein